MCMVHSSCSTCSVTEQWLTAVMSGMTLHIRWWSAGGNMLLFCPPVHLTDMRGLLSHTVHTPQYTNRPVSPETVQRCLSSYSTQQYACQYADSISVSYHCWPVLALSTWRAGMNRCIGLDWAVFYVPANTVQVIWETVFTGQKTQPTVSKYWRKNWMSAWMSAKHTRCGWVLNSLSTVTHSLVQLSALHLTSACVIVDSRLTMLCLCIINYTTPMTADAVSARIHC